ncbi:MAG TPA: Asp-tRNA(Asn)/Glu-tRNA(Gln) amidotransferase subunit GatC [Atribacteraceae bacterium]|nr:Asp-tRNA(Asn)/Glu-tRNA(Gln) amidotransferase subunit GatC [Atribacteraceae bacterium]
MSERLSREDVKKIAQLARLDFTDDEVSRYLREMNEILSHFAKLNRLDLSEVCPTSHISWDSPPVNPDTPVQWKRIEEVFQNAPETRDRFFIVPRVVDKKEERNEL